MATDLTRREFQGVNGEPIVAIAESTLKAGGSMVETWTRLEPMVRTLTERVGKSLDDPAMTAKDSASLLHLCASVIAKIGSASVGVLRASEGLSKLSLLLSVGTTKKAPADMTERQLTAVVLETARKIVDKTGKCPFCQPILTEPSAESTPA